jgi:hypothetical protein
LVLVLGSISPNSKQAANREPRTKNRNPSTQNNRTQNRCKMAVMSSRTKVAVIVCVAIFAFTAIAAVPMFALFDAQTPMDALFWAPTSAPAPPIHEAALPASPTLDLRSPRAPPLA